MREFEFIMYSSFPIMILFFVLLYVFFLSKFSLYFVIYVLIKYNVIYNPKKVKKDAKSNIFYKIFNNKKQGVSTIASFFEFKIIDK